MKILQKQLSNHFFSTKRFKTEIKSSKDKMDQLNTQFQKHLCFSFLIKYDWKFTPHGEIFFTIRCKNTPNSVKVDFYTSKCKKKVKFNRKIVSLVGESFYTKGCKSVKVNFYTLWCNGQHSKEYPKRPQKIGNLSWCNSNLGGYFSPFLNFQDLPFSVQKNGPQLAPFVVSQPYKTCQEGQPWVPLWTPPDAQAGRRSTFVASACSAWWQKFQKSEIFTTDFYRLGSGRPSAGRA